MDSMITNFIYDKVRINVKSMITITEYNLTKIKHTSAELFNSGKMLKKLDNFSILFKTLKK